METAAGDSTLTDTLVTALAAAIQSLRERSRTLLRDQGARLRELELRLEQQLTSAIEQLAHESHESTAGDPELGERVELLEREVRRLEQLKRDSEQALEEARVVLAELEEERRALRIRLEQAEQQAAGASPAVPGDAEETERLHRRLELAMQEIKELKSSNEQLLDQVQRSPAARTTAVANQFDWESQKRRLLEQLESNFDASQPDQAKERLRCEEVIRTTDRIIAEKDRQIEELQRQLADQPAPVAVAPPPDNHAAAAELLDADELIRTERERLAKLQGEWQEKLRQAEVEVSIERAKLARERLQLEEKLRMLQSKAGSEGEAGGGNDGKGGSRGRWLTRLGLRGDKDDGA